MSEVGEVDPLEEIAGKPAGKTRRGLTRLSPLLYLAGVAAALATVLWGLPALFQALGDGQKPPLDTPESVQSALPGGQSEVQLEPSISPAPAPTVGKDGVPVDAVFPDEVYPAMIRALREQWGDGSDPKLSEDVASNPLIYSVASLNGAKMPDLSRLSASPINGSFEPGDGVTFRDSSGNAVISFYLDNLAIRSGDDRRKAFSYVSMAPIGDGRSPVTARQISDMKESANLIAFLLFTGRGGSDVAGYFDGGKAPQIPDGMPVMGFYQTAFVVTDYARPADGVYIAVQPVGAPQSLTIKFEARGPAFAATDILLTEEVR